MRKKVLAPLALFSVAVIAFAGCGKDIPLPAPTDSDTEDYIMQDGSFDGLALMSDVERAFCEATGKTLYFEEFDAGGEWELHVYTEEDGEEVEWYYIDEQGEITDSAGEIVTLDDFRVRDEVLAGLGSNVSSHGATDIEWTDIVATKTDGEGYTCKMTFHVSPWIFNSNTDILNAAWEEVGTGQPLPGIDEMGLVKNGELYEANYDPDVVYLYGPVTSAGYAFSGVKSDMYYYCLGSVEIENITPGWDFSESNPREWFAGMPWVIEGRTGSSSVGRVFYSGGNSPENHNGGVAANALMKSNHWGPIPFILVTGENFTPNNPDGEYYESVRDGYFQFYESIDCVTTGVEEVERGSFGTHYRHLYTGVIGRDGIYAPAQP